MYDGNFSLWCDFVERDFIGGEFKELLNNQTINGATSNPSIFKSAILNSSAYLKQKEDFKHKKAKDLYEILATTDIKLAAQAMLKNFANKDDGFISIEVDPNLSDNANATYEEGKRLYGKIAMPNVMIKIPATEAGFEAMSDLMSKGVNINATLIFSPTQTKKCLDAFQSGTEKFKKRFLNADLPQGVISVFVSRFDRLMDDKFNELGIEKSKLGIYNATKCYHLIQEANLPNVRTLFASTGVKGDDLKASYYIDELMFKNAINTAPLETIKAFLEKKQEIKEPANQKILDEYFANLEKNEICMKDVYSKLLSDGLNQFEIAFDEILKSLK
ncbi:transaldolase [Campylobacter sp. FMV-PI01]|uniref:Transaldolase n=1 Tax=Campylobacter portucalensis TaxID=2608384 RepID=A0A6L5WG06_9BACT|nr:transaldolase [Campylobacter portucalensis]MSN95656.1 transaldolase [Campylobacter portucalensis]